MKLNKNSTFNLKFLAFSIILILYLHSISFSKEFGLGLNFVGANFRYKLENKILEFKIQFEENIYIFGGRYYKFLKTKNNLIFYIGIESDFINFKSNISKGTGFAFGGFVGVEKFLTKNFSINCDISPIITFLQDDNTKVSLTELNFVLNISLNYYFKFKK